MLNSITLLLAIVPFWMGAHHRSLPQVAVYVIAFGVFLYFFGPKPSEVQGNPNKPLMALFSLAAAAGISSIGYAVGSFILG